MGKEKYHLECNDKQIVVYCSEKLGIERFSDYFQRNKYFRTSLITARASYMEKVMTGKWLVEYNQRETMFPTRLAERELRELNVKFYDDKIVLTVPSCEN